MGYYSSAAFLAMEALALGCSDASLVKITGENPIAESDRGDLYAMATAWIEWFQRRSR